VRTPILKRAKRCKEVRRGAEYFSSEDFQRNCEVVKLVVVLQQYSTLTQQRVTQPLQIRERPRHCLNYSSDSTSHTGSTFAASATPICLGNSVRSTGPTETVSATAAYSTSTRLHHQARIVSATASQYWNYRTFDDVQVLVPFKRPEVLLTGPLQRRSTVQARTVQASLLKVLSTVSKHGS
jgi:hypothetical protein